jgi:hypothetical protein
MKPYSATMMILILYSNLPYKDVTKIPKSKAYVNNVIKASNEK